MENIHRTVHHQRPGPGATTAKIHGNPAIILHVAKQAETVVNAGLGARAMDDVTQIIDYLRERCNAGKNKRVCRQQFKSCTQRQGLSIDNWLCELRDLARKCEFETCCNRCDDNRCLATVRLPQHCGAAHPNVQGRTNEPGRTRPRPPSATRSPHTIHQRRRHNAQRLSIRWRPHHGRLP